MLSNTWARPKGAHRRHYYRDGHPICGKHAHILAEPQADVPVESSRCRRCTCREVLSVASLQTRRVTSRCALEVGHAGAHVDWDLKRRVSALAAELGSLGGRAAAKGRSVEQYREMGRRRAATRDYGAATRTRRAALAGVSGTIDLEALAREHGVSTRTIRRDLAALGRR